MFSRMGILESLAGRTTNQRTEPGCLALILVHPAKSCALPTVRNLRLQNPSLRRQMQWHRQQKHLATRLQVQKLPSHRRQADRISFHSQIRGGIIYPAMKQKKPCYGIRFYGPVRRTKESLISVVDRRKSDQALCPKCLYRPTAMIPIIGK